MALLGKKNKESNAGAKSSPRRSGNAANRSVFTYLLGPAAAILLSVCAAAWWSVNQAIGPVNEAHQEQLVSQLGSQYEAYFNNVLSQHQHFMRRLVDSADLVDLIRNGTRVELNEAERRLASSIPYGLQVHLFPQGEAAQQRNARPPLSFAGMDMIRRTEQGQNLPVEAHQYESELYLHSVSAVHDETGSLIGTLSVSQDMQHLEESLNGIDGSKGNVVVVQKFQNSPEQTLLTYGVKTSNDVITLSSNNPNWTLTFQPADTLAQSTVFSAANLWGPFGLIFIVTLVSLLVAGNRLQTAMRHDAHLFARFIQRILSNLSVENQSYRLSLFNNLAKSVNRLRMGKGGRRPAPVKASEPAPAVDAPRPPAPVAEEVDNDFDISMLESDEDILGMDSPRPGTASRSSAVSPDIFRAYDIGGVMGETLNVEIARLIGLSIGSEALDRGEKSIVVARDGRLSSAELSKALVAGVIASGGDVVDVGAVPTPLAYFAMHSLGLTSCVVVTGSHFQGNWNGFKVVLEGNPVSREEIKDLHRRIKDGRFHSGNGSSTGNEISSGYVTRVTEDVTVARPLKVVVDCGNGIVGQVAPTLLKSLGCYVLPLYCNVDGNFPNHLPDPGNVSNLRDLARTVVETRADIGLAFDGDGDRLGLVTNSGKIVPPDRLLMLLAKEVVTRNPGSTIIYDLMCSRNLHGLIVGYGGKPLMWKTGHSHIKRKMKETNALLAGDMGGHVFYQDRWYGFDDALYTACRLLEIVASRGDNLDALFASFPEDVSTPEMKITLSDDRKLRIVEQLRRDADFTNGRITDIDGLRVDFPDGWGVVRASNTSPALVCRFEADTDQALVRIRDEFRSQLQAVDSQLQIPF